LHDTLKRGMGSQVESEGELETAIARAALDALDVAVIVMSSDLQAILNRNQLATVCFGATLPPELSFIVRAYVSSRHDVARLPAARVEIAERRFYVRVVQATAGRRVVEIGFVREEVARDVDTFRLLNARHGVSRREYQILSALRLGKTNRAMSEELGIAQATVKRHIERLLARFGAPNRTRLVDLVEQIIARR